MEQYWLPEKEYGKIIHEIDNSFEKYKNENFCVHKSLDYDDNDCYYYFVNNGFNEYIIVGKVIIREET